MTTDSIHPPILATGAHEADEGYACTMELVSWIQGETFTDLPTCSNYSVSQIIQRANDRLGDDNGTPADDGETHILTPTDSLRMLKIGFAAIGTVAADKAAVTDFLKAIRKDLREAGYLVDRLDSDAICFAPSMIDPPHKAYGRSIYRQIPGGDLLATLLERHLPALRARIGLDAVVVDHDAAATAHTQILENAK